MDKEVLSYEEVIDKTWERWDDARKRGFYLESVRKGGFSKEKKSILGKIAGRVVEERIPIGGLTEKDLFDVVDAVTRLFASCEGGFVNEEDYWRVRGQMLDKEVIKGDDLVEGNGWIEIGVLSVGFFKVGKGRDLGYVFLIGVAEDENGSRDAIDEQMEIELGVKLYREGIPLGGRTRLLVRERLGIKD